jgi:hypothetical protein
MRETQDEPWYEGSKRKDDILSGRHVKRHTDRQIYTIQTDIHHTDRQIYTMLRHISC